MFFPLYFFSFPKFSGYPDVDKEILLNYALVVNRVTRLLYYTKNPLFYLERETY